MLEFLAKYAMFEPGLLGAVYTAFLFFLIGFAFYRSMYDNPLEKAIGVLMPMVIVAFFAQVLGFPSILTGIIVLVTLLLTIKINDNVPIHPWIVMSAKIMVILFISGFSGPTIGFILFLLLIVWYFVEGEIRIRKNKSKAKKEEKESEEKKE